MGARNADSCQHSIEDLDADCQKAHTYAGEKSVRTAPDRGGSSVDGRIIGTRKG